MVRLSELSPNTFVDCNGDVMTAERAIEKAKTGEVLEVYLITDEYIENVLGQCWEQHKNGNVTEKLSAPNNGEKVIVDICIKQVKCVEGFCIEKCDGDGFTIENDYFVVEEDTIWNIEEDSYRLVAGEIRLINDELGWLEISKETLEEHFEIIN